MGGIEWTGAGAGGALSALDEALDFGGEDASPSLAAVREPELRDSLEGIIVGGVDPGKKGYSALLHPDGTIEARPVPMIEDKTYDLVTLVMMLRDWKARGVSFVMVEAQQAAYVKPGPGVAKKANSMVRNSFQIGYGYALWQLGLMMAGIPHAVVTPSVWKKEMGITVPSSFKGDFRAKEKEGKRRSVVACQRLYPEHDLRRNPDHHSSKPSPDQAEAILLARYAQSNGLP